MARQSAASQEATNAPAVHTPSKAKYVTVASKMPMHIEIQLCEPKKARVTGQFGSVEETVHVKTGKTYVIRGTSYPVGQPPKGFPKPAEMIEDDAGGYALTKNIPADFFTEWMRQNAETEMVQNGIIKVHADLDSLAADCAEHAKLDSGLGALNPDADDKGRPLDRRSPRPANASVQFVKPEPRTAA